MQSPWPTVVFTITKTDFALNASDEDGDQKVEDPDVLVLS